MSSSMPMMLLARIQQEIAKLELRDVGDIEFMSKKEFDGKRLSSYVAVSGAAGVGAIIIPAAGKTFYLSAAQASRSGSTGSSESYVADLRNNGAIIESVRGSTDTSRFNTMGDQAFRSKGDSLDGDGVLAFDINVSTLSGSTTCDTMLEGYIEDDADDPSLVAQSITVNATIAEDTGDIAKLIKEEKAGNLLSANGELGGTTGTVCSIIPANGKTFFLSGGGINDLSGNNNCICELQFDGTIEEKARFGGGNTSINRSSGKHVWTHKGKSLVGDGAKLVRVEAPTNSGVTINASIQGIIEDT